MAEKKDKQPDKPVENKQPIPAGFRKLKPGKSVCFGTKNFSSKKKSLVPESVIKKLKLDDKRGDKPALSDNLFL